MNGAFRRRGDKIAVLLGKRERDVLSDLPTFVAQGRQDGGPAAKRLDYVAHPEDLERQTEFADMTDDLLDQERKRDANRFTASLRADELDDDEAMAWVRLIGEARLILAARLGITDSGWEADEEVDTPEVAMLHYLGWLQDGLIRLIPV